MMKAVVLACVLGAALALPAEKVSINLAPAAEPSFEEFKASFAKVYVSSAEHEKRAAIYQDNVEYIQAHNAKYAAGEATFTMGVNEFSDMTHDEFKALYIGPKIPERNQTNVEKQPLRAFLTGTADSVDWRAKGAVTPVKNQGQCGSCWSFSTTGSTEGRVQIATGKLTSLSEQQLMDCSVPEGDHSCQGGLMDFAFEYIEKNGGIDSESDYPYKMRNEPCDKSKEARKVSSITSHKDVMKGNEEDLATAVAAGPVSIAIEADQRAFQMYKSGVFSAMCGTKLDHGVLIVGYGEMSGEAYWIVKNSWGATWGQEGYILMAKGKNECGLANQPSYPIAGKAPPPSPPSPSPPPPPPSPPGPSGGHYGDPNAGPCADGDEAVRITGLQGSFCSPKCGILRTCPKNTAGGVAKGECVLETQGSQKPTQCALICQPGGASQCPAKATCKAIQGTGLCTYDS